MSRRLQVNEDTRLVLDILAGWKKVFSDCLDGILKDLFSLKTEVSKLRDDLEELKEQQRRDGRM